MRSTLAISAISTLLVAACSGGGGGPSPADVDAPVAEHHARFVGLWALEQPEHALYEVTYYALAADGAVTIGPSEPADCSGHLARHCVTGSVARCTPEAPGETCAGAPTCVIGDRWHSAGDHVVVFAGVCSDGVARDLAIELAADASHDTAWGGAGGTLLTVGGEPGWSHDNWTWAFRKCPTGTTPATCHP